MRVKGDEEEVEEVSCKGEVEDEFRPRNQQCDGYDSILNQQPFQAPGTKDTHNTSAQSTQTNPNVHPSVLSIRMLCQSKI